MHGRFLEYIYVLLLGALSAWPVTAGEWRHVETDLWFADSDYTADVNVLLNAEARYQLGNAWALDSLARGGLIDYGGGAEQFQFDLETRAARPLPRAAWCEVGAGLRLGHLGDGGSDLGPLLWLRVETPEGKRVQVYGEVGWVPIDILSDYEGENAVIHGGLTVNSGRWRHCGIAMGYRLKDYYNLNNDLDSFGFYLGVIYRFDS